MQKPSDILNELPGHEYLVSCVSSQGIEIRANCLKLNRHQAVFEVYTPQVVLFVSEGLTEFKIAVDGRVIYSGRAVVRNVISADTVLLCEATLEESWVDVDLSGLESNKGRLAGELAQFLRVSCRSLTALPEFKLVVADLQMFLMDLRQWLDQVEFGVRCQPAGDRKEHERQLLQSLESTLLPMLGSLFERFDQVSLEAPEDMRPVHSLYVKRVLHPIVLSAPFMYRTFQKPLGYAGDYEMVNMMTRDPYEGATAFARMLNAYFLSTPPVVAHRNRLEYLTRVLTEEALATPADAPVFKAFNLGCGPALEIQQFLQQSPLSDRARFTLLDFNDETIDFVSSILGSARSQHRRRTEIVCHKRSVVQVLKEASKPTSTLLGGGYHLVYCAGLFDYLGDSICEKLVATFYDMLLPGGAVVVTNVHALNPSRPWMEYSVDWHLIHRDRQQMLALVPKSAPPDAAVLQSDSTGMNLFLKLRKPVHA